MDNNIIEKIGDHLYYSSEDDSEQNDNKITQEPDLYVKVVNCDPRKIEKKDSPFVYHSGSELIIEAAKERKGMSVIAAFETGLLNSDSKKVISYFSTFEYLNAHLIKRLLDEEKEVKDEHIKKIMSNLYKLGIVVRMKIQYIDNEGVIHKSPSVYALSDKYRRLGIGQKAENRRSEESRLPECSEILSRLAFNQFYISINRMYGLKLALATYKPYSEIYKSEIYFKSNHKTVALGVAPIRLSEGWESRVASIIDKAEGNTKMPVFLVETETAAVAIHKVIQKEKPEKDEQVLYICDYATNDNLFPFEHIIKVNGESTYNVINIKVD